MASSGVVLPLLIGGAASFAVEGLLTTRPYPIGKRPRATLAIHLGLWLFCSGLVLLICRRPWFSISGLLTLELLIVLISNAKYHSLREPFIFQDFSYFVDALRYPRLYLPFLGMVRGGAALLAGIGAVWCGVMLESPLAIQSTISTVLTLMASGAALVILGNRWGPLVTCDPVEDLRRAGLLASLWWYFRIERHPWPGTGEAFFESPRVPVTSELPNLVIIQSESFFDPRRWYSDCAPDVLAHFDRICSEAVLHGPLTVPAWGANTVRTEYAFLSGIANERLGIHRFKPYRRMARQGIPTIVSLAQQLGYRTVCLHPYDTRFYGRDVLFPLLGFEEFIDITEFDRQSYAGQYVGDRAVGERICAELATHGTDTRPLFLFVITMENHGPLHLEEALPGDRQRLYRNRQPEGCEDLTVYLRHLEHADIMLGNVREWMRAMERPGWLCLYGDHPPIMPKVYRTLGEPDGTVDFLVWSNRDRPVKQSAQEMRVEHLAVALVREAGVMV